MPERIYKLQPNRTLHLRGFDSLGAAAAVHTATANSFKVSGVFRDPADFAVLILHDADNFFEHPRLRYLPDFDFDGLTLQFDMRSTGLMPLDSPKFPTIDWPYLDVIAESGTRHTIPLRPNATQVGGTLTAASGSFTITGAAFKQFDRVTLWYKNLAFDYLVPQIECAYAFTAQGAGTVHRVTVAGVQYSAVEASGDTNTAVALKVVTALAACPLVSAIQGDGSPELGPANQVNLRASTSDGAAFTVSSTAGPAVFTLYSVGLTTIAANLALQINQVNWVALGVDGPITAVASGATVQITAAEPGYDGNMITLYSVAKNTRLQALAPGGGFVSQFSGGISDATWRVTLNFAALGVPRIRQMWLTFAPRLANGAAYADTEWQAEFTNWTLSGTEALKTLQVAGPASTRVEEDDSWCIYTSGWVPEVGFYSQGWARRANAIGQAVTIRYSCATTHDLYLGTSLYTDRAAVGIRLDNDTETQLNCYLDTDSQVNTRRRVRSNVPAGIHSVTLVQRTAGVFYFDFLEAAVPGDVPDAPAARDHISPALDYSTDHTYKLTPARLLWNFDKLGFTGPMNEYIGVFWWNQRKRVSGMLASATVTLAGTFDAGDAVFVNIGGRVIGKSVFPNENNSIIASHFAYFINETFVGVWAQAVGGVLTIHQRSASPAYSFTIAAWKESGTGSSGSVTVAGSLSGGQPGTWEVDPSQSPALNRGARDWHRNLFDECKLRNREIVVASSMELVNPPLTFAARFPDNQPVITSVGFGSLMSTHCAFSTPMLDYQKQVFAGIAGLMADSLLVPNVQFGEFVWWSFSNQSAMNPAGGMGFYDSETTTAAQAALGRPLHLFTGPDNDPGVNGSADALFLRNRLRDYAAALGAHVRGLHPTAKIELLYPHDVNHPTPAGANNLGGRLNAYVNFPAEWGQKTTSGFDRLKMEALDFGAWSRNLNLAMSTIGFPLALAWPKDSIRHLIPVFRAGYAWEKEYRMARGVGIPIVNLWAFDHVCIYGLSIAEPRPYARAVRM
ncbi:MAG: hypothetical protein FJW40_09625 [Acidobacteria bacterium]|nr:hypothetical protein [Acidobacteriota bacterium]